MGFKLSLNTIIDAVVGLLTNEKGKIISTGSTSLYNY